MTGQSIVAPPVTKVAFNGSFFGNVPPDDGDPLPPGAANEGNTFRFDPASNYWIYNLGTKQFTPAGTCTVSVAGGDNSEYLRKAWG